MRKTFKLLVNIVATAVLVAMCFSFSACGQKITEAKLNAVVYDYENETFLDAEDSVLSIDLYGHLAPKTVEKMSEYINEGYYNGTIVYKIDGYDQLMFGDLVLKDGAEKVEASEEGNVTNIIQNSIKPQIKGEFELAGVTGSDLKNVKGTVGLWRSWYEVGNDYNSSGAMDTGRATWYMPCSSLSNYNDKFCVFGKIDLEDEVTSDCFTALDEIFDSSVNYTKYVIYFTGTYDETKPNENYGLTFNCVTKDYFDKLTETEKEEMGIFEAKGRQLECYNEYTIKVANNVSGKCGAMIKTAKIEK